MPTRIGTADRRSEQFDDPGGGIDFEPPAIALDRRQRIQHRGEVQPRLDRRLYDVAHVAHVDLDVGGGLPGRQRRGGEVKATRPLLLIDGEPLGPSALTGLELPMLARNS